MTDNTHGGRRANAGRKPIAPSGETMRPVSIRLTEQQREDLQLVTHERVRAYITKTAHKLRKESK